ncbi:MAG: outer membrane lipoprotein-sorting protein [Bradymonadia bacterium]|jgi:outer membrane lipoprotein-sorting protein
MRLDCLRLTTALMALIALFATPAVAQISPSETDPGTIMKAVQDRPTGDKVKGKMVLTITDAAGRERTRAVEMRGMEFAEGSRQIMIFSDPADVKGTGLLSVDYDDGAKEDDQWLYLPSLHKSTRISSGNKAGSFMGTAFSYADMTEQDPTHWEYTLLKPSVQIDGEDCWLIEARPKTKKAKQETGYLKTQLLVSKSKLMPLRTKAWVRAGKKIKLIAVEDIKKIGDVWVAHTLKAKVMRGKKLDLGTVIQLKDLTHHNADVTAELFTQRQLETGL